MTNFRRHSLQILPLLILMPLASQAEPPVVRNSTVAVECDNRYISQRDAARVLHTDNFSQTYAKRQSLYADVARLCHSGINQVVLMAQTRAPQAREARRVAAR
ncbi:MAG: hypothetical protein ACREPE_02130 [Lysobacter sp.]